MIYLPQLSPSHYQYWWNAPPGVLGQVFPPSIGVECTGEDTLDVRCAVEEGETDNADLVFNEGGNDNTIKLKIILLKGFTVLKY
jgi:hypothetical protein